MLEILKKVSQTKQSLHYFRSFQTYNCFSSHKTPSRQLLPENLSSRTAYQKSTSPDVAKGVRNEGVWPCLSLPSCQRGTAEDRSVDFWRWSKSARSSWLLPGETSPLDVSVCYRLPPLSSASNFTREIVDAPAAYLDGNFQEQAGSWPQKAGWSFRGTLPGTYRSDVAECCEVGGVRRSATERSIVPWTHSRRRRESMSTHEQTAFAEPRRRERFNRVIAVTSKASTPSTCMHRRTSILLVETSTSHWIKLFDLFLSAVI